MSAGKLRQIANVERYRNCETGILHEVWRLMPDAGPLPDWLEGMRYAGRIVTLPGGDFELVAVNLGDYLLRDLGSGQILTETPERLSNYYLRVLEDDAPSSKKPERRSDPGRFTVEGQALETAFDLQDLGELLEKRPELFVEATSEVTRAPRPSGPPVPYEDDDVPAIRITVLMRLPRDGGAS